MLDTTLVQPTTIDAPLIARSAGLRYVDDSMPGISRMRRGDSFAYIGPDGNELTDDDELARIRKLAIPPAYEHVWICPDPRGHLQATGRDARNRKQYRYHPEWRRVRDGEKFARMIQFGEALPRLRRKVSRDLGLHGLPRDKVVAIVVGLLDATRVRIGNEAYARENASFGLTTLRNRHAKFVRDGRLILQFRGKGGAETVVQIDDRRLVRLVRKCQQLPGQSLFQFVDDAGARHALTSDHVNEYLRAATGADFTAKDFRTWGATLRAIGVMARTTLPDPPTDRECKRCIVAAVKTVADELRNTPAVCRKSYINPVVFDAWRDGSLHASVPGNVACDSRQFEKCALQFLRAYTRNAAKANARAPKRGPRLAAHRRIRDRSHDGLRLSA